MAANRSEITECHEKTIKGWFLTVKLKLAECIPCSKIEMTRMRLNLVRTTFFILG